MPTVVHRPAEPGPPEPEKRPKPRLVPHSPEEGKRIFARNLDQLITVTFPSRKDAAEKIGVSYRLIRRLVSAGVSRLDDRNVESLGKIASYFALPLTEKLWWPSLVDELLTSPDGQAFVAKHRSALTQYHEEQTAKLQAIDVTLLEHLAKALGKPETAKPEQPPSYVDKTRIVLSSSSKAAQFQTLIDDYYEFVMNQDQAPPNRGQKRAVV
jgi:transcriptional regulator with XRE-family HTH domain